MDLNTSQSTRLTSGEADDTQPSVSRDGRRLLFLRNQRELYVMPAAGGRPSLLHAFEGRRASSTGSCGDRMAARSS